MVQGGRSEDVSNTNDTVSLQDIPEGSKVRLRSGAIGLLPESSPAK